MLGQSSAVCLPDAVVTCRQLLPPYPSSRARDAFLGPHHDGASAALAQLVHPIAMTAVAAKRDSRLPIFGLFISSPPLLLDWLSWPDLPSTGPSKFRSRNQGPRLG